MATVLVVDDRATNREVARLTLDDGGHEVIEATAGREALDLARRLHPDVVLADVVMPGMDGYEFVSRLRADAQTADIPVLLYTANYRPDEVESLAEAYGVTRVVSKSADPHDLLDAVEHALLAEPVAARDLPADVGAEHLRTVNAKLVEKVLALDESEARFQALADVSPVGIVSGGTDLEATYINPRLADITGLAADRLLGQGWMCSLGTEPREQLRRDGVPDGQAVYYGEIGPRWLQTVVRPIVDDEGRTAGFVATVDDVTALVHAEQHRHAEERRRIAERFDSLARLSGAIAHDFNNMLNVILSFGEFTTEALRDAVGHPLTGDVAEPMLDDLDRISHAGRRAAHLAHQLLTFGGREVVKPAVLDLHAVLDEVIGMIRGTAGDRITITAVLAPGVGNVVADGTQLIQVLLNLADNAREAMPGGGTLTFTADATAVTPGPATGKQALEPGDYVRISVRDTGQGMTPEVLDRAMEPFFTTKPKGHGTGLGLATAYGLVRQAGGDLVLESGPGRGTTVHLYLPATDEPVAGPPAPTATAGGGGQTVLLADDEDGVREAARRILTRAGYTVLTATDGRHALGIAREHPGPIHVVLSDVVMPRMNGPELAGALRQVRPGTRVLYMSGYADPLMTEQGLLDPSVTVVGKPFTAEQLLTAIHTVLPK
ncbi:response regulator [Actinoplanes sp. NPDC051861]|uniref:hybrid sensor histidine kinase/response regulator n=1 Tax=Actinoplanes sp. NPDC051861 TaxID=3155170 RepID=UPI0034202698